MSLQQIYSIKSIYTTHPHQNNFSWTLKINYSKLVDQLKPSTKENSSKVMHLCFTFQSTNIIKPKQRKIYLRVISSNTQQENNFLILIMRILNILHLINVEQKHECDNIPMHDDNKATISYPIAQHNFHNNSFSLRTHSVHNLLHSYIVDSVNNYMRGYLPFKSNYANQLWRLHAPPSLM